MTASSILRYFLCFILLFHDCIAPQMQMYKPIRSSDSRGHQSVRKKLAAIANDDPCSQSMWVLMNEKAKKKAQRKCEEAYNLFFGLPDNNRDTCLNAAKPECRPLPSCDGLIYGCMFECGDTGTITLSVNEHTGRSEQEFLPSDKELKHLKVIIKEILDAVGARSRARSRHHDTTV